MIEQELTKLLVDLESDRVERKASLSDKSKVCQAICAFANDMPNHQKPGVLFVGANDDGSCANLRITDSLLLELSNIRSDGNIQPMPVMEVRKETINHDEMVVVLVEPSRFPPVRYNGTTYIRVGPRRAIATVEEELRLRERQQSLDIPFDIMPAENAAMSDLDVNYFSSEYLSSAISRDILDRNNRTLDQQLLSVKMAKKIDNNIVPTVLGLLTLGDNPEFYLSGDYVQYLKFEGADPSSPIVSEKRISGRIGEILARLDDLIELSISSTVDFVSQNREVRKPNYPIIAIQQIVRNAILHRNYQSNTPVRINWFSDRIEIISPGGPYGEVSVANFGQHGLTSYRNPNIAEVMRNLGYVQKFGMGIELARSELKKNGNPDLEFDVKDSIILATIRSVK